MRPQVDVRSRGPLLHPADVSLQGIQVDQQRRSVDFGYMRANRGRSGNHIVPLRNWDDYAECHEWPADDGRLQRHGLVPDQMLADHFDVFELRNLRKSQSIRMPLGSSPVP